MPHKKLQAGEENNHVEINYNHGEQDAIAANMALHDQGSFKVLQQEGNNVAFEQNHSGSCQLINSTKGGEAMDDVSVAEFLTADGTSNNSSYQTQNEITAFRKADVNSYKRQESDVDVGDEFLVEEQEMDTGRNCSSNQMPTLVGMPSNPINNK